MNNKERLEEIKSVSEFQIVNGSHYGKPAHVILNGNDVKWLIEQAERLEAIIKHRNDILKANEYLNEQNQRYKQALEFVMNNYPIPESDYIAVEMLFEIRLRIKKALEEEK